ncbi:MAG TPA: hypothetical protein PK397_11020 [Ignavibacteriaceae bacterium]|nr:hypothetical protein [Ignavibacteriaceae bacterium]
MKSKRNIYIVILLSLLLSACGGLPSKRDYVFYDIGEGYDFIETGDLLLGRNQLEAGLHNYLKAYEKFTLIDYRAGKLTSSALISRVYLKLGNKEEANKWILKCEENLDDGIKSFPELTLLKAEYFLNDQNYREILLLSSEEFLAGFDLITRLELTAYRILALIQLSNDYSKELLFLRTSIQTIEEKDELHTFDNPLSLAFIYYTLGYVSSREGKWKYAVFYFDKSLAVDKGYRHYSGIADNLYAIGIAYKNMDEFELAKKNLVSAVEVFGFINDANNKELAETELLLMYFSKGNEKEESRERLLDIYSKTTNNELKKKIDSIIK